MQPSRIVVAALCLALAGTTAVLAENVQVKGAVTNLDSGKHQVTLSDGQVYVMPENLKADGIKVGDQVTITAEKQDGANIVKSLSRG